LILGQTGHLTEAIPHFEQALRINPRYAEAHSNLGFALQGLGRPAEAVAHYQEALRLQAGPRGSPWQLGNVLVAQGKLAEAATHLREAVRLNPRSVAFRENLAKVEAALLRQPSGPLDDRK